MSFDVAAIRAQIPILRQEIGGRPLVYLDNAASTQRPDAVIDAITRYYRHDHANVHRAVHTLSVRATEQMEAARRKVQHWLGAAREEEVVFTSGTTEGTNLVAWSWGRSQLGPGDQVVVSHMEHHANIVPWQLVCQATGATLAVAPIHEDGSLDLDGLNELVGPRTRLVGCVHASNALGTINPIDDVIAIAKAQGARVLIDGAQAAAHVPVDVQSQDIDFYALSGHKIYGPTGIGVLYGKHELLEQMPPFMGGGDMIDHVSFEGTTFAPPPSRFEAGTPHIAGIIGLGAALDWLGDIGLEAAAAHEESLRAEATERLEGIDGVRILGTARDKVAVISFVVDGAHPHDVGTLLNEAGVAVRTGHHCAEPLMARLGVPATARASFAVYNNRDDIDALVNGLRDVVAIFG